MDEELFFYCDKCGGIMTEVDFAFNREIGKTECICGHCRVGRKIFALYKEEKMKKSETPFFRFLMKNIFCFLTPYFLYGELVYLFATGIKDKTFFLFRWLFDRYFGGMIEYAHWIGLGLDVVLMLIGLAAIIYKVKCIADGDGFIGYEEISEQHTMTTYSESSLTGKVKGHTEDVTVYNNDNISLNIMIFLWNMIKVLFLTVIGAIFFIISLLCFFRNRKSRAPKKGKERENYEFAARFDHFVSEQKKSVSALISRYSEKEWKRKVKDSAYLSDADRLKELAARYVLCIDGEPYYLIDENVDLKSEFKFRECLEVKTAYMLSRPNGTADEISFFIEGDFFTFIPYRKELFDREIKKYSRLFSYNNIPHDEEELTKYAGRKK